MAFGMYTPQAMVKTFNLNGSLGEAVCALLMLAIIILFYVIISLSILN